MTDLTPHVPQRPLIWPEFVLDLQAFVTTLPNPVYVVGGAVRDAMLHRPTHDIDLITPQNAISLSRKIANHYHGDVYVLDAERDVGRAIIEIDGARMVVDVARFRGSDLLADLVDRDFTMNAMAVDLKGDLTFLIDPLGGAVDLGAKRIRRCSPASLASDPVRAWRAVRQSAQFGFRLEAETLRDVRAAVASTREASTERLRDELVRVLSLPRPTAALRVLDAVGLLSALLPDIGSHRGTELWDRALTRVEHLTAIMNTISYMRTDNTAASFSYGMIAIQFDRYRRLLIGHLEAMWPNERPHRALLMLAALLVDAVPAGQPGEWVDRVTASLRLSNAERMRLMPLVEYVQLPLALADHSARSIHRFWRQVGDAGVDLCLLALATYLSAEGTALKQGAWLVAVERIRVLLEAFYEKADQLIHPPPLVDGTILMRELRLKGGPLIGELLEYLLEEQAVGTLQSTEASLEAARVYLANRQQF
jgi:poly(A) polymerase